MPAARALSSSAPGVTGKDVRRPNHGGPPSGVFDMPCTLVVGGAGYIGSHMVKLLAAKKQDVVVLDNLSRGHRAAVRGHKLYVGDLGDAELLRKIFTTHQIDVVMHFAAFSLVGESVQEPLAYFDNNTGRTTRLLSAMQQHGIDKFIFSSTAAVYGEPARVPIEEDAATVPTNPYGRSKRFLEQILQDADTAFGLRSVCLRYFNAAGADASGAIGEDHTPESHLIPIALQVALGQRAAIDVFGTDWSTKDGTCVRDFIHVTDLAEAHVLAAEHLRAGGKSAIFNLGSEEGYTVQEILAISRKVTGHPIPAKAAPRRAGDPAVLVASSHRIKSALHWQPKLQDPEAIIATAWQWHKSHPHGFGEG
jgi:UDP-glucose 4-epimerase